MRLKKTYIVKHSGDLEWDEKDEHILNGMALGKTRKEIAKEIFLDHRTIDKRVDNMAEAMGVHGMVAVTCKAIALGIIKNPYLK